MARCRLLPPSTARFLSRVALIVACFVLDLFIPHESPAQDLAEQEEQAIRAAVERVAPAIVRIETVGGLEQLGDVLLGEGPTTGLVVSSDGLIISSAFNFVRQPTSVLVTLPGGRRVPARFVARDHGRKLVLLRVAASEPLAVSTPVPLGEIAVGQAAIAIGRTFNADKPNVSVGIISARQRIWGKAVQTDAKVSPSNYGGPLVDIQGRVFGVLVPLSPSSQHELAGAEWYDGGIGFAVPLVDIYQRFERMKAGEDLFPGVLGVTLKPGDIYSLPAELVTCHPKSPAYQAGLRAGDSIVAVNGARIERQVQLRHALGPLCAGEKIELEYQHSDERRKVTVELAKEIEPYEHPFLGVLPTRDRAPTTAGVGIRYVYPGSPGASAGMRVADRIRKVGDRDVANVAALREVMAAFEPRQNISLTVDRAGADQVLTVPLGAIPRAFPPAEAAPANNSGTATPLAVSEIKIPEEPNECIACVPSSYRPESPHGLLIVLPLPGEFNNDDFTRRWSSAAERYGLIIAAPRARLPNMWLPAETTVIRKVIDHVVAKYNVDRARIVVWGTGASGSMAYLTAFRLRDVVRGVVAVDAVIPLVLARPPDNDPIERLFLVVVAPEGSAAKSRIRQNVDMLREMKYPVIHKELAGDRREMDDDTTNEVLRWLDTLDQI